MHCTLVQGLRFVKTLPDPWLSLHNSVVNSDLNRCGSMKLPSLCSFNLNPPESRVSLQAVSVIGHDIFNIMVTVKDVAHLFNINHKYFLSSDGR